ncbi:ABC transporter substrate-binding protein [Suttonella ornithocola]|uniref:Thiamine biosynthesis protein HI_0357 n=1 Tax=Suttonella ornithocola TaxID=279832 RepID=A0A380MTA3_9GAMM|nr:Putative thiamine biosynthesis protein HI_0357 [Suttonella ornithocola]
MKKLLILSAIWMSSAQGADKLNLMLDWFINPNHAAIIVAKQKGYFKKYDLDVDIEEPSDPSIPPKMVSADKVDLAVSYQPQLYLQHAEKLPVSRVGTLISTPLNTLIVKADSSIKTIADLKDKRIGYSVAGIDEAMLKPVLATGGLTLDDVKLVNVNFSLSPAVMSGQVDAVIGGYRNFELYEMKSHGKPGRAFYLEEHGIPAYDELILIANNNKRNDPRYRRFNEALEDATQYILNHPEDAWKSYISYKKDLNDDTNRSTWTETLPRLALRPAALDTNRYRRYGEFMQSIGLLNDVPNISEIAIEP